MSEPEKRSEWPDAGSMLAWSMFWRLYGHWRGDPVNWLTDLIAISAVWGIAMLVGRLWNWISAHLRVSWRRAS